MEWPSDDKNLCDGLVGVDARELTARRGSLIGFRRDLRTAFMLPGSDYHCADLSSADLSNAPLRGYRFTCVSLRLATLSRCFIFRCDFRRANLRGATLRGVSVSATDFRHADLRDTDLRHVRFGVAQEWNGWRGCNLDDALLDGADLRGATYRDETIWPVKFDPDERGATRVDS